MKKFSKWSVLTMIALFSMGLTSCGGDDEPANGGNTSGKGNYSLTVDGDTYYYGAVCGDKDFSFTVLNSSVFTHEDFLNLHVEAYDNLVVENYSPDYSNSDYKAEIQMSFEKVNFATLSRGKELNFYQPVVPLYNNIRKSRVTTTNGTVVYYDWSNGNITGKVTFQSYDSAKRTVTLKLENITMYDSESSPIKVNGTLVTELKD